MRSVETAKRFDNEARGRVAHPGDRDDEIPPNPEGVSQNGRVGREKPALGETPSKFAPMLGNLTRGALGDPGLCCSTPSAYFVQRWGECRQADTDNAAKKFCSFLCVLQCGNHFLTSGILYIVS